MLKNLNSLFIVLSISFFVASCSPNPRRVLTAEERVADMMWIASKIEANYAPLKYKEELHGFNYNDKKSQYIDMARQDQTNEAFYHLMASFLAELKDGHVNLMSSASSLPGRSKVAYLGFSGERVGSVFKVKKFIPTFKNTDNYPVKVDDKIIEIDGVKLTQAIDDLIVPFKSTGNQESNYTAYMGSLFARKSLDFPMPDEKEVTLKIKRGPKEITVVVPWVIDDYAAFAKEQREAAAKKARARGVEVEAEQLKLNGLTQIASLHPYVTDSFIKNMVTKFDSKLDSDKALKELATLSPENTFEFSAGRGLLSEIELYSYIADKFEHISAEDPKKEKTTIEKLKEERYVPGTIVAFEGATVFPAYVAIYTKDKKRYAIGYIRIDSFSPPADTNATIKEFKATLKFFRDFGVNGVDKLVIDLVNNGGGSLNLGMRMAALLSSKQIDMPTMKYRLNDAWVDEYHSKSISHENDAARAITRDAYNELLKQISLGQALSDEMEIQTLYPFQVKANDELVLDDKAFDFKIAVITNEMCASMCDIFSSILKENKMATFIGKQTMGAGGNVVQHFMAPNSNVAISLTESLVVSSSGELIENNGIKPDIDMDVSAEVGEKYKDLIIKAFDELIK